MAATITEFVKKGGKIFFEGNIYKQSKEKFSIIGNHYSTLRKFKEADVNTFNSFTTVEGERCFKPLTSKEILALTKLQDEIDLNKSIEENFIVILTKDFIKRQIEAIDNISLDNLNANPLLCRAIKLNSVEEFMKFYTYSALSRSIVTSMGFLVQDLLLYSNDNVFDGKNYEGEQGTKWDIVIEKLNGVKSFIEVKSGPNDLDKTQILSYDKAIKKVLSTGNEAFLGITYGKKEGSYVSTSILETYVESWRDKTLIGTELWDFISSNNHYHKILMDTIQEASQAFLGEHSLITKIDEKIYVLIDDFNHRFSSIDEYYASLW